MDNATIIICNESLKNCVNISKEHIHTSGGQFLTANKEGISFGSFFQFESLWDVVIALMGTAVVLTIVLLGFAALWVKLKKIEKEAK